MIWRNIKSLSKTNINKLQFIVKIYFLGRVMKTFLLLKMYFMQTVSILNANMSAVKWHLIYRKIIKIKRKKKIDPFNNTSLFFRRFSFAWEVSEFHYSAFMNSICVFLKKKTLTFYLAVVVDAQVLWYSYYPCVDRSKGMRAFLY